MSSQKGFTLVEILIVVTIISLLVTLAIHNYLKMTNQAKTSEAKINPGTIYYLEMAFKAEKNRYTTSLDSIGFESKGIPRYSYSIEVANESSFLGAAEANLDGDPASDKWTIDQNGVLIHLIID